MVTALLSSSSRLGSQHDARIEVYSHAEGRRWIYQDAGPGEQVPLTAVEGLLDVDRVYRGVELEPAPAARAERVVAPATQSGDLERNGGSVVQRPVARLRRARHVQLTSAAMHRRVGTHTPSAIRRARIRAWH